MGYKDTPPQNFFSPYISGAQRLSNGNTLIVEGTFGRLFEITATGEVVWEYVNPYFAQRNIPGETAPMINNGELNAVFRVFRYETEEIAWL